MPARKARGSTTPAPHPETASGVDTLLSALTHPRTPEIQALRAIILASDSRIAEGVKWNAPSFRTTEYFATFHLRAKEGVQLILHFGARVRADRRARPPLADPAHLLTWLANDRATATFRDLDDIAAKRSDFQRLLQAWIELV